MLSKRSLKKKICVYSISKAFLSEEKRKAKKKKKEKERERALGKLRQDIVVI